MSLVVTGTGVDQHAYLTNIEDDGTLPLNPTPNWYEFNNFRSGDRARDEIRRPMVPPHLVVPMSATIIG